MTTSVTDPLSYADDLRTSTVKQLTKVSLTSEIERKVKNFILSPLGATYECQYRKYLEAVRRDAMEWFEQWESTMERRRAAIHCLMKRVTHRTRGRSTGTHKSSAKKSSSSSSGGGGGGDGEGDGPKRTYKQKKNPSSKHRKTPPQHLPSTVQDASAPDTPPHHSTSQHPPSPGRSPSPFHGLAPILLILCVFVVVLLAMDQKEMVLRGEWGKTGLTI